MRKGAYPENWHEFSRHIRHDRAGNKCEKCQAPNGQLIARGDGWYMLEGGETFSDETGERLGRFRSTEVSINRFTKVVLTVAHLDHKGGVCNCEAETGKKCAREDHVLALCQRCHLLMDIPRHKFNTRRTRAARVGQQWLGDIESRYRAVRAACGAATEGRGDGRQ